MKASVQTKTTYKMEDTQYILYVITGAGYYKEGPNR